MKTIENDQRSPNFGRSVGPGSRRVTSIPAMAADKAALATMEPSLALAGLPRCVPALDRRRRRPLFYVADTLPQRRLKVDRPAGAGRR